MHTLMITLIVQKNSGKVDKMAIIYHYDIEQGSKEWAALRRGVLTASNISKVLTPAKLEVSNATGYLYEVCRQRLDEMPYGDFSTKHTERGHIEEPLALQVYEKNRGGLRRCGFVENTNHGFKIGCSPDALCGDEGLVQVKSFTPNVQFGNVMDDSIDAAHMLQVQMELFVTERTWCDLIYHSSGTHQMITRVIPDAEKISKIKIACGNFYSRVDAALSAYRAKVEDKSRFSPTEYVAGIYDQPEEMFV